MKTFIRVTIILFLLYFLRILNIGFHWVIYPLLEQSFKTEQWLVASKNERNLMLGDLLTYELKGSSRDKLLALLGPADREYSEFMCYNVGNMSWPNRFMAFDYNLCFFFKQGRVNSFNVDD